MRKGTQQEWKKCTSGMASLAGLAILLLAGFSSELSAQTDRLDEEAVKMEELLIDASREKLLSHYDEAIKLLEKHSAQGSSKMPPQLLN